MALDQSKVPEMLQKFNDEVKTEYPEMHTRANGKCCFFGFINSCDWDGYYGVPTGYRVFQMETWQDMVEKEGFDNTYEDWFQVEFSCIVCDKFWRIQLILCICLANERKVE